MRSERGAALLGHVPGVAVAVMRNRFTAGDLTTVARIDRIVAETLR